jgi:hypothetical protein
MVLPRPALIAILGGVLVLAAFAFTRVRGGEEESAAPSADQAAETAPAAQQAKSGELRVRLAVRDVTGTDGLDGLTAEFGGPFESRGATAPPVFDFDLELTAPGEEAFRVGAVSTGDRGFVTDGDTAIEVPAEAWDPLTAMRSRFAELGRQAVAADAPRQPTLNFEDLLVDGRSVGRETIDGVETVHTAGEVDVPRALRSLTSAAGAAGGPEDLAQIAEQVEGVVGASVKEARADLYVGREDGIMRRFRLEVDVAVPRRHRADVDGLRSATVELTVDLTGVNTPQEIAAPRNARQAGPADAQTVVFGSGIIGGAMVGIDPAPGVDRVDPAGLAQSAGGEAAAQPDAVAGEGLPAPVARALDRNQVFVLLFTQDGSDDEATSAAVKQLDGVKVFRADIADIGDYRRVVSEVGINQAPAVVIVDAEGRARLVEGYTDAGSLAQQVEDAR